MHLSIPYFSAGAMQCYYCLLFYKIVPVKHLKTFRYRKICGSFISLQAATEGVLLKELLKI